MVKVALEAPWYTYQKKVKALFERDKDIIVGDIYQPDGEDGAYALDIEVRNHEKFVALDRVLPDVIEFGNVRLNIVLFDEENSDINPDVVLYETIFKDNPIVKKIIDVVDPAGVHHGYVCVEPEVIQFFDDDLTDYKGNWSGLAQDIAREVFDNDFRGVFFCTADKTEA